MYKIAILSFYSGVVERGVETFCFEIARRLSKDHKVTIFQTGKVKPQKFRTVQIKAFAASPKSHSGILGKFYIDWQSVKILIFTIKVIAQLFRKKYDLVIPLNGGWQTTLIRIFSKISKSKMLISGHAGIGSDDAWNLFFRPDVFVALTSAQKEWANKLVPEVKKVLIPNGVDLSRFNPKVKPKVILLPKPIAVCVSALDPYKRVDLTIKAAAKAKNLSLLVLGDGEMRGLIDTLGKRLLGKRYLRIIAPYQEIPSYYRSAEVFTLASKTEAFGISYVEAMACNLPVVTTNDNSRAEIVGQAGILTDPADISQYARDLIIATKTNYKNIPYMQALKFSWNKIADSYSKLIKDILQN
ncbi:hypothetical protein A3D81_01340 [Candidatus Curtissbacteria bacterium RIFCSPHIGHO2_02_FULL_40_17]|uniref:Glycosyl transferase family 1 domain-containing protein n=2 Tax=Candidatus Curtissiibacteriota TaxID=1752717 RepID=A0A1F5GHU8_9BACT|nr:MAG: hypothetical protein A3D81_01340 [Candidatus Curtissbacteria bacterium RIFCSPHIGHO2_02_FULL_40_17]OGE08634.1 MAG: hypothetical protein A3I53_02595 [Candidatus Curtissbacteria bacterium RIFCSPLOWO2_02_FULL_40_13b]